MEWRIAATEKLTFTESTITTRQHQQPPPAQAIGTRSWAQAPVLVLVVKFSSPPVEAVRRHAGEASCGPQRIPARTAKRRSAANVLAQTSALSADSALSPSPRSRTAAAINNNTLRLLQ